jgi:signal transduction histidine kinase
MVMRRLCSFCPPVLARFCARYLRPVLLRLVPFSLLRDIRARMALAAMLPMTLVTVALSGVFLSGRYDDLDEAHQQWTRTLARQLASASEYGLFSANLENLQALTAGALRESGVRMALVLDARGEVLAASGSVRIDPVKQAPRIVQRLEDLYLPPDVLPLSGREWRWIDPASGDEFLIQPVRSSRLRLDEVYEGDAGHTESVVPNALGYVVVEISHDGVAERRRSLLGIGLAVMAGGLLLGLLLAWGLGRGVVVPVMRVSSMIRRIGAGDLSVRGELRPDDPLRALQDGLNQMAQRLQRHHEELEQRVAQATTELRARKEEAELATQAKSRFLAAASHDLRQPIHALGMFVARLAQLPHDAETRRLIAHLEASVRAMQDLLDALLDISRLDADAVQAQVRPVLVAPLLAQLRGALLPVAQDKGLQFRVRQPRGAALWVYTDPTLLHRILLNLLSNALRYTGEGGVLLSCRVRRAAGSQGDGAGPQGKVLIEVWDTGVGIAPEHQEDIFREFYQIGNPERDRSKGLGLGLNIVHRTVRLLGHPLRLTSRLRRGTRFTLELPLAPEGERQAMPPAVEPARAPDDLRGLRVLVIEDDGASARALEDLLRSWGCTAAVVESLRDALAVLDDGFEPDVMLSDYRLRAGENGMRAVQGVRQHVLRQEGTQSFQDRDLPAALMSGDTDPDLIQLCRELSLPLLHKPVRPAKLRTLLRRLSRHQPLDM